MTTAPGRASLLVLLTFALGLALLNEARADDLGLRVAPGREADSA